jgi:hypothetical protein
MTTIWVDIHTRKEEPPKIGHNTIYANVINATLTNVHMNKQKSGIVH